MLLGLGSRHAGGSLPGFVTSYAGDTLYATLIVLLFGAFLRRPALPALVFCFVVEGSQRFHPAWLDTIRATTVGALVLGRGFLWSDLVCYGVGVGIGVGLEGAIGSGGGPRPS